jgi:NADH-quinone oxidoreductase subunit J
MTGLQIIFLIVAAVTLFSAVMVVSVRKMMHAVLWLVQTLFGVAVLFATLQASFFAVIQILVYIGAIAILIIFSVMLTRRIMEDSGPQVVKKWWLPAIVAIILFVLLASFLAAWPGFETILVELPDDADNIAEFGKALLSPQGFVIPFEVASVLLLAAMIGAIYIAIDHKENRSA